ncbi:hypothetical protein FHW02_003655 [Ochrobactrum sp. RH1CCR137]|uniref:hypothetical protein n=1 Tax=Brucella intermedia TaxID=94625 RepID=UPI00124D5742|nr:MULTISPECIES: hypothetical protein [Brucella/Ochrobactrum group]KAB2670320.1 hypothetical protein F9K77_09895 [Ochrobactrum sp. LMG 5442]MBA8845573.1 hypothetical protein [Ochrobactrum sp. RH1CCR137]MBA8857295.1 hypothetical protein [Ochrobactrum sp. RH1CCR134]
MKLNPSVFEVYFSYFTPQKNKEVSPSANHFQNFGSNTQHKARASVFPSDGMRAEMGMSRLKNADLRTQFVSSAQPTSIGNNLFQMRWNIQL